MGGLGTLFRLKAVFYYFHCLGLAVAVLVPSHDHWSFVGSGSGLLSKMY